jgi:hypothetical protein
MSSTNSSLDTSAENNPLATAVQALAAALTGNSAATGGAIPSALSAAAASSGGYGAIPATPSQPRPSSSSTPSSDNGTSSPGSSSGKGKSKSKSKKSGTTMSAAIQSIARSQIAAGGGTAVGAAAASSSSSGSGSDGKGDPRSSKDRPARTAEELAELIRKANEKKELEQEREDDNHEDLISYAAYKPAKLKFGVPHPDPVVENSSLAAIPPPDISCKYLLSRVGCKMHVCNGLGSLPD